MRDQGQKERPHQGQKERPSAPHCPICSVSCPSPRLHQGQVMPVWARGGPHSRLGMLQLKKQGQGGFLLCDWKQLHTWAPGPWGHLRAATPP